MTPYLTPAQRDFRVNLIVTLIMVCVIAALVAVNRWIAPPGCAPGMMEVTGRAGWYPVRLCVPNPSPAPVAP